ncbi:trypsin-like peptidase domain-containing protein [Gimesia aquarii]|uniref:Uncharacterized protein n=1 Tax=Gimesia aquarii TaxID=2527964 RepID=A0A517VNV0_9PLAN|nr:trypsin-like peptidase domain-containing protein [Gimesia aquarii]QDT94687.1 hypothetical protein V144x_01180 [Gimesia aquarii]
MVRVITIIVVLILATIVQAQALVLRTVGKQCTAYGCHQIIGTGACAYIGNIDDRSIYLTAAHNLEGNPAVFVGYAGRWWQAKVIHKRYQKNIDYAVIETQKISANRCFKIAEHQPDNGVDAVAYGYANGIYNMKTIRAKIRVNRNGRFFSKLVAKGDSGGPIVVNDRIVGIIKGHDYKNTLYTESDLIRVELFRIYGRLPACGGSVIIAENPPKPDTPVPKYDEEIAILEGEISKLRGQLDQLSKTKIPVQIIGSNNKVLSEQKYLLGDPIKLRFKAVKK